MARPTKKKSPERQEGQAASAGPEEGGHQPERAAGAGPGEGSEPGRAASAGPEEGNEPGRAAGAGPEGGAAEQPPADEERPAALYVVSDSLGFVGAFASASAARAQVLRKYPLIPFVVQEFALAPGPYERVWVVPLRGTDAVVFASNDRDCAERARSAFARCGHAYEDPVDYWEQPLGHVRATAAERLDSAQRANLMYAGEAVEEELRRFEAEDMARLDALAQMRADGPIARAIRESERVTIYDCVVPAAGWTGETARDEGPAAEGPAAERAGEAARAEEPAA